MRFDQSTMSALARYSRTPSGKRSPRGRQQLRATAQYDDGSRRDVTRWTRFVSNHDNIAAVDDAGQVTLSGIGEAVIRAHYGGQVAIAVTGIAGPDGGQPGKPVGTVWFGWAWRADGEIETRVALETFAGDREAVRRQTVARALNELLRV